MFTVCERHVYFDLLEFHYLTSNQQVRGVCVQERDSCQTTDFVHPGRYKLIGFGRHASFSGRYATGTAFVLTSPDRGSPGFVDEPGFEARGTLRFDFCLVIPEIPDQNTADAVTLRCAAVRFVC